MKYSNQVSGVFGFVHQRNRKVLQVLTIYDAKGIDSNQLLPITVSSSSGPDMRVTSAALGGTDGAQMRP